MRRPHFTAVTLALAVLVTGQAVALWVNVEFVGSFDIAAMSTYAWDKGTPAPNREIELALRGSVDAQLATKGYRKVEGDADFLIAIHVVKDDSISAGVIRIEAYEWASHDIMWRGRAEGVVSTQSIGKRKTLASRTVKKMFKKFPDKR
jgi:hypothetical protein